MAGKRQTSDKDNTTCSKVTRLDADPQNVPCPVKTSHEEMLSYKSFLSYSLPGFERHNPSNPWSSAAAYLQYAGNALSQRLTSEGSPLRSQRQETERLNNHSQFTDITGSHLQVQQRRQVVNYPLPSAPYPSIAMPRPVYVKPSSFMGAGYGTHGLSPLGVHGRSPHINAQAVEWNSTHLAYSSSPMYPSGVTKKTHSSYTSTPETGKPSQTVSSTQDLNAACRNRDNPSVSLPLPSSHNESFINRYSAFSPPNPLLLYAHGDASTGRQFNSAFSPLTQTHQNYMPGAIHCSMDSRWRPVHTRPHYGSTGVAYPHTSSLYNYSENTNFLPYPARGGVTNTNEEHGVRRAEVTRDTCVGMSHTSKNLKIKEMGTDREPPITTAQVEVQNVCSRQVSRDTQFTSAKQDLPPGSVDLDKDLHPRSTALSRNTWAAASREKRERMLGSPQTHRDHQVVTAHGNSSKKMSDQRSQRSISVSSGELLSKPPVRESLLTSTRDNTFNSPTACNRREGNACINDLSVCVQQSEHNVENLRQSPFVLGKDYGVPSQNDRDHEKHESREQEPATQSPNTPCDSNSVIPETNSNRPNSPPMPVINDVFSLAPYRDYLEGTAPHPFPLLRGHREKKENNVCPILPTSSPERTKEIDKVSSDDSSIESVSKYCSVTPTKYPSNVQGNACRPVFLHKEQEAVLDLRLKKSTRPYTPSRNQGAFKASTEKGSPSKLRKTSSSQMIKENPLNTARHSTVASPSQFTKTLCTPSNAQATKDSFPQRNHSCPIPTTMQTSTVYPAQTSAPCFFQESSSFQPSRYLGVVQSPMRCALQAQVPVHTSAICIPQNIPPLVSRNLSHCSAPSQEPFPCIRRERTRYPSDSSHYLCPSLEPDNEGGFHSSKAFMFKKYKIMKLDSTGGESQLTGNNSASDTLPSPFPLPSETVHSLPPSAPESSPTLGEANVSLASGEEPAVGGSGRQFSELHYSVRQAISRSIMSSPPVLLQDWLSKSKEPERPKSPVKSKLNSRSNEPCQDHEIWLAFDGVPMLLHKLLSHLETFMFTRRCPFPHVIRAGAIFIPIYLVKEVLFSELVSTSVDRVLQRHKVELRPTTLSEEKLLREKKLKDCPSRMLKLLALKQLPDVYPDLLHLYWGYCVQKQLGNEPCAASRKEGKSKSKGELEPLLDEGRAEEALSQKRDTSLILKLHRVSQPCGNHVYRAQELKPHQDRSADKNPKKQVCLKKSVARKRKKCPYQKRRKGLLKRRVAKRYPKLVGKRILHLFDDGKQETWFRGKVQRVHKQSENPRDTQYEVWYDDEPGTRYFLELLQDYEKGWLRFEDKQLLKKIKIKKKSITS